MKSLGHPTTTAPSRPAWGLWLLWGFVLIGPAIFSPIIIFVLKVPTDFVELYDHAFQALQAGQLNAETLGFYPPSAYSVFISFALLSKPVAAVISCLFYAGLYFVTLRTLPKAAMLLNPEQNRRAWISVAVAMGGYIFYDLVTGQVSAIVLFSTIIGYVCWQRGHTYRAAAALAVGIAFKLLPAVCLVFFAVKRQWRMVMATLCLTLVFTIIPGLLIFGPVNYAKSWQIYYEHVVYPKSNPVEFEGDIRWTKPATFLNPSLNITMLRWLSDYPQDTRAPFLPVVKLHQKTALWIYRIFVTILGLITFWHCRKKPTEENADALAIQFGIVLTWMVLISPHLGIYYMVWALWPVTVIKGLAMRNKMQENRIDRLNSYPLRIWIAGFFLSTVTLLRATGFHPALLLMLWSVLLIDVNRLAKSSPQRA